MPTIDWATRRESTILRGPGDPGLVTSTENYMQIYEISFVVTAVDSSSTLITAFTRGIAHAKLVMNLIG
jgi:hypothetical protein